MQELSQYNVKKEYRQGKEAGKLDCLTRRERHQPIAGDEGLTRNVGILLPEEGYWDMPATNDIKLDILAKTGLPVQEEGKIQPTAKIDDEVQAIRENLDNQKKHRNGIALGLCQWKEDIVLFQEELWIQKNEGIQTTLVANYHDPPQAGHSGIREND